MSYLPARSVLTAAVCCEGCECSESRSGCSTDYAVSLSLISCLGQGVSDDFHRPLSIINQPGSPDTGTSARQPLSGQRQERLQPRRISDLGLKDDAVNLGNLPSLIGESQKGVHHKEETGQTVPEHQRTAESLKELLDLFVLALIEGFFLGRCSEWAMAGTAAMGAGEGREIKRDRLEKRRERGFF